MSIATITFTDMEDGSVSIKANFGDRLNEQSEAHAMAAIAIKHCVEIYDEEPKEPLQ